MKLTNTLLLLALAGGLFAFIRLYESRQLSTREAQERAGKVVTFDRDKVDVITIKNSESKIRLRKDDKGVWHLEEPVKDRADLMAVSQLFTTAESLRSDAAIGDGKKGADKDQLREYGLSNSETKVKFTGKDKPVELLFGKDAAIEGKVYVKLEDSNTAYVIGKDLKEQISKKADDFRDRKLTDVSVTRVHKAVLKTKAGEIELERKDRHWMVTKPLKVRGDDSRIGDLISQAATAPIESFIDGATNASNFGFQEPRATLTIWMEDEPKPTVIHIGANPKEDKDKEKVYVQASTREGVVIVPKAIENLIDTKPNDLRDKNLVRVEADIIDRISIEGVGAERILLARSGESWVRKVGGKDEAIHVAAAKRLLDEVLRQQVAAFVADVATELPKYGLDQPQVKLTFSSYASENTAETKAGDKPIVAMAFGKNENGNVYARLEDEPFIVSVSESLLSAIMTDPLQWQPLDIYNLKAEDFLALEITREGQPPLALTQDKEKGWKLAKGDGTVNQINVQSLVNTLAKLRAVHWVGAVLPEHGLDRAGLVVTFKTAGGGGGKLVIGASSPEELAYASTDSRQGVFGLSKPDLSAFQLPLLEKATVPPVVPLPSATPVPPPEVPAAPTPPTPPTEAPARPAAPQP